MASQPDLAALNVQPRQRRRIYEGLAKVPAGLSVKDLLREFDVPESDLRETLRKLDAAGLAQRIRGTWRAVPLEDAEQAEPAGEPASQDGVPAPRG
jgi:DNA-binding GntR family transcriptional regulator